MMLTLPQAVESQLREQAERRGIDAETYAARLLARELARPRPTLEEIAAEIERRRGGPLNMTEDEISEMLEKAKHEMRAERRARAGK